MLIVVQNIQDCLRVLHLHLLRNVGSHQELCPCFRHSCELPTVIIKSNMNHMGELGWIGDVWFLIMIFALLQFSFYMLCFLLRFLRKWSHVYRKADLKVAPIGSQPKRWCWWFLLLGHHITAELHLEGETKTFYFCC